MTSGSAVTIERDGAVATIRLSRSDNGNAIDFALASALAEAVDEVALDVAVRCVVLTGSGRFFCVGGDLDQLRLAGSQVAGALNRITCMLHTAVSRLLRLEKPLICSVNGPAAGAGLGLAVLGDIVFAARSAHFSMAYTAVGLTPDGGVSALLPRLIGLRRSQDLLLTNRRVLADEAERIGLVSRVVDDESLVAETTAAAQKLVDAPLHAIAAAKRLFLSAQHTSLETQLAYEARCIASASASPEGQEGLRAFAEKRTPAFYPGACE